MKTKTLTDEAFARQGLGWRKVKTQGYHGGPIRDAWRIPKGGVQEQGTITFIGCFPNWTMSLDDIVAEVKAKKLIWGVSPRAYKGTTLWRATLWQPGKFREIAVCVAETEALALCQAMIVLRRSKKHGKF